MSIWADQTDRYVQEGISNRTYIRLEMLCCTYMSFKSVRKDIFQKKNQSTAEGGRCILHKMSVFFQGERMGYLACKLTRRRILAFQPTVVVILYMIV